MTIVANGSLQFPPSSLTDTSIVSTLKDVQKAYGILHQIDDQQEMLRLDFATDDPHYIRSYLTECIKECEILKSQSYNSSSLNKRMQNYISLAIQTYHTTANMQPGRKNYSAQSDSFYAHRKALADFLVVTYALDHFVHLSEETYWKTVEKKNYIRSDRYSAYLKLKDHNKTAALSLLDSICSTTSNFQERTIYQLEVADQYETNNLTLKKGWEIASQKYKSILDAKQYCLYLYEAWLKWRLVTQQNNGLSHSSDIPNHYYDEVRDQVADVVLEYVRQNPKDEMAINQFFVIVSHDIVFRFGSYPYGNQNTVEYHETFGK